MSDSCRLEDFTVVDNHYENTESLVESPLNFPGDCNVINPITSSYCEVTGKDENEADISYRSDINGSNVSYNTKRIYTIDELVKHSKGNVAKLVFLKITRARIIDTVKKTNTWIPLLGGLPPPSEEEEKEMYPIPMSMQKKWVQYEIKSYMVNSKNSSGVIERRYNDFSLLDKTIREYIDLNQDKLPTFLVKRNRLFEDTFSEQFIKDRALLLENYLQELTSTEVVQNLDTAWDVTLGFLNMKSHMHVYSSTTLLDNTLESKNIVSRTNFVHWLHNYKSDSSNVTTITSTSSSIKPSLPQTQTTHSFGHLDDDNDGL